jgi:flagellar motor switch protein FliM
VDITGELTGAKLTIGEIFKLKLGDIITVDSPEELDLKVNGIAKRKAKMGDINGRVGLKVLS